MGNLRAAIGYSERTERKPFFYANAHEKDFVPLKPAEVEITDARGLDTSLDREGFVLAKHKSAVSDLTDLSQVGAVHSGEIVELLKAETGCDHVAMTPMGILRFSEKAGENEAHDNSHPARFVHVDMNAEDAANARNAGAPEDKTVVRSAMYNVWRVLSGGTQDVPLALCDYTSVAADDLIDCTAIFDPPGGAPEWRFGNYLLEANPAHRWYYYSDMQVDEAIIFKTSESDPARAQLMPHGAFDNPLAPDDAAPRISLEMRGTCYWFAD